MGLSSYLFFSIIRLKKTLYRTACRGAEESNTLKNRISLHREWGEIKKWSVYGVRFIQTYMRMYSKAKLKTGECEEEN